MKNHWIKNIKKNQSLLIITAIIVAHIAIKIYSNAVLNYGGSLLDLVDSTLYVTVSPCHDCAKMLCQLKIKEVVYLEEYQRSEMWEMSKYLFDCCGISYRKLEE